MPQPVRGLGWDCVLWTGLWWGQGPVRFRVPWLSPLGLRCPGGSHRDTGHLAVPPQRPSSAPEALFPAFVSLAISQGQA